LAPAIKVPLKKFPLFAHTTLSARLSKCSSGRPVHLFPALVDAHDSHTELRAPMRAPGQIGLKTKPPGQIGQRRSRVLPPMPGPLPEIRDRPIGKVQCQIFGELRAWLWSYLCACYGRSGFPLGSPTARSICFTKTLLPAGCRKSHAPLIQLCHRVCVQFELDARFGRIGQKSLY
jgi:hypothetical protein